MLRDQKKKQQVVCKRTQKNNFSCAIIITDALIKQNDTKSNKCVDVYSVSTRRERGGLY